MAATVVYRARQFVHALGALASGGQHTAADAAALDTYLTPAQRALFHAMPAHDRRHSLAVLHTLVREGETDPDLLAAALLHDVGKSEYDVNGQRIATVPLWCRVLRVLILRLPRGERLMMRLAAAGARRRKGLRHALYLSWEHPRLGAEIATRLGVSPLCAMLIREHMRPPHPDDPPLLIALQRADDRNLCPP